MGKPHDDTAALKGKMEELRHSYVAVEDRELEQVASSLDFIRRIYRSLPETKDRPATIPELFGRKYDENFISDYLAVLLDPKKNSIGSAPLEALCRLVDEEIELANDCDVRVHREYSFADGGGRVDLLVVVDDALVVAVENKLLAEEGPRQTSRYARSIDSEFPGRMPVLVFLTRTGTQPRSKRFHPVSFAELYAQFRAISYNWLDAPRMSFLWEDFLDYLEEVSMTPKGRPILSEKARLYAQNHAMLKDLRSRYESDCVAMTDYLRDLLASQLDGEWQLDLRGTRSYQQIFRSGWRRPGLFIHFEYHFRAGLFLSDSMDFRVDVEGKSSKSFMDLFRDGRYPRVAGIFEKRGIKFCPDNHRQMLAYKSYPWDLDAMLQDAAPEGVIEKVFLQAWEEHKFLIPELDAALAEWDSRK